MEAPEFLRELVVVFAVAVAVVLMLSRVHLPAIAGFIVAGALVGPSGLGLVKDAANIEALAEVGVVLLLFTIGLEFSLERLRRLWRPLALGGGLQVGLTVLATAGLAATFSVAARKGVFLGFLVALSSTAIVLRALSERREVDAPHGRLIVGVLIFQDLCVVPMMLLVPMLAGQGGSGGQMLWALGKAVLLVVATLALGRVAMPRALGVVAGAHRRELFLLAVLLLCTGIAWLTALAGLTLALGAFLAGIALAESEYGHQALSEVLPFREALASLFFISVGMLFDVRVVLSSPLLTLGLVAAVLVGKASVATVAALVMRFPPRVAVLAGVGLAQVGEFSFVLSRAGAGVGLLGGEELRLFVTISVLTMLVTPLLLRLGPHLAAGAAHLRGLEALVGARGISQTPEEAAVERAGHIIVAGYGVGGRLVAHALTSASIPHVVVELDPERVRASRSRGENVYYGDITSAEILAHAGVERARALLLLINDPDAVRRAMVTARRLAPDLPIIVRTQKEADIDTLVQLGASDVVAADFEAAVEAMLRVLRAARVPEPHARSQVARVRTEGIPGEGPVSGPRRMLGRVGGLRTPAPAGPCPHLSQVRELVPRTRGCEECMLTGRRWVHLRLCLGCGHVGCCDSSEGRHAAAHFVTTGHPIMRSLEPGETWAWCYVDMQEVFLEDVAAAPPPGA